MSHNGVERGRIVIAGLIATAGLTATIGIVLLVALGHEVPPALAVIAGGALGALCTAFTRFPPPGPGGED